MRILRCFRWSVAAAVLAVSAAVLASPKEPPAESAKPAPSLEAEYPYAPGGFDRRDQAIRESLRTKKNPPWAGRYFEGANLGEYFDLWLAPDAGAAMTRRGTFGYLAANHGAVVESPDGVIRISLAARNDPKNNYFGFPDELVPIAWSERQYLIPPRRIAEFVSAINHGDEPRRSSGGRFLMRRGDDEKPVTGLPTLPSSVRAYVRHVPVEVRVTSVALIWHTPPSAEGCADRFRLHVVPVTTAEPPLFIGEQLTMPGEDRQFVIADVTALHGESADAELFRPACELFEAPKPGDQFTTGAYKARPNPDVE